VEIWDSGTWEPLTEGDPALALADGHLSFDLAGKRLHGGWTLHRTSDGAKPQWLLIKRKDDT
jgi:bifunctional non-homologous end joining protein LigD